MLAPHHHDPSLRALISSLRMDATAMHASRSSRSVRGETVNLPLSSAATICVSTANISERPSRLSTCARAFSSFTGARTRRRERSAPRPTSPFSAKSRARIYVLSDKPAAACSSRARSSSLRRMEIGAGRFFFGLGSEDTEAGAPAFWLLFAAEPTPTLLPSPTLRAAFSNTPRRPNPFDEAFQTTHGPGSIISYSRCLSCASQSARVSKTWLESSSSRSTNSLYRTKLRRWFTSRRTPAEPKFPPV